MMEDSEHPENRMSSVGPSSLGNLPSSENPSSLGNAPSLENPPNSENPDSQKIPKNIKKRVFLSVQQKIIIAERLEKGTPARLLCSEYGVSQDVIHRIRRERMNLSNFVNRGGNVLQHKNRRRSSNEDLENRLYRWFMEQQPTGNVLNDSLLKKKAVELFSDYGSTSFVGSRGWLRNFKKRYGIRSIRSHDEKVDANDDGAKMLEPLAVYIKEEQVDYPHGEDEEYVSQDEQEETMSMERDEGKSVEGKIEEKSNKEELNFIEKKKKDLNMLEDIIKRYSNNNQAVLIMGEAMRKILENEAPQIKETDS